MKFFTKLREQATEMATRYTTREIKDIFLIKIKPISSEAHRYCKGLFKHQEAQQIYTKLKDKQDREEVIQKLLEPARIEYHQAEQRLQQFLNERAPIDFTSDEYKRRIERRELLQKEVDEARKKCDVEKNSAMMETVKSLKDLDDHSETYRLFATSVHYGYFVIIFLGWVLYSLYYTGLWAVDRIPAQRRDLKYSQKMLAEEVTKVVEKVDKLNEGLLETVAGAVVLANNTNNNKIPVATKNNKDDENEMISSSLKKLEGKIDSLVLAIEKLMNSTNNKKKNEKEESSTVVQDESKNQVFNLYSYYNKNFFSQDTLTKVWNNFLESNNPINLAIQFFMMVMMMFVFRQQQRILNSSKNN